MLSLLVGLGGLAFLSLLAILIYPLKNGGKWDPGVWKFVNEFDLKVSIALILAIFVGRIVLYLLGFPVD